MFSFTEHVVELDALVFNNFLFSSFVEFTVMSVTEAGKYMSSVKTSALNR